MCEIQEFGGRGTGADRLTQLKLMPVLDLL
jgi:hypothetical protein